MAFCGGVMVVLSVTLFEGSAGIEADSFASLRDDNKKNGNSKCKSNGEDSDPSQRSG
jgi:hypothetical protein